MIMVAILSCAEDTPLPQGPGEPTIDDLVLANMLAVQEAAEAFAAANGGEYARYAMGPRTPDGRTLIDFLPDSTRLANVVTGNLTDPLYFEPDGVGSTSYRGYVDLEFPTLIEHWVGYGIIGRGETRDIVITVGPDTVIAKDDRVIQNCYLVQAAVEAFAADNNGVYANNGGSVNPLGKKLTDYLPGGRLLINPYSTARTEPNWGGLAATAGGTGYLSVDTNGDLVMDGYNIDGITGDGYTQIIYLCDPAQSLLGDWCD